MSEPPYSNIRKVCEICGEIGSVERHETTDPMEGLSCGLCERWVCVDCICLVDSDDYNSFCKECCSCQGKYSDGLHDAETSDISSTISYSKQYLTDADELDPLWKDPIGEIYGPSWNLYKNGLIVIGIVLIVVAGGFYFFG
jgi:hypothetical protein